jgi:hypothetical protein
MINVRTLLMTSIFRLVDGLLERWSPSAAIFKAVEPLFHLSDPHSIIAESLLNSADCFRLGIPKFSDKT